MQEEDITYMFVKQKLGALRNEIMEFSGGANDCNIVMTSFHSENVGEIKGSLGYGSIIKDKEQHREYDALIEEYSQFTSKLLRCDCKQKYQK